MNGSLLIIVTLVSVGFVFSHAFAWYDTDWAYSKKLTLDASQVSADLTNFPLMVNFTDTDVSAAAQSDCDDIIFVNSANTTRFEHDLENCELETNDWFTIWVNIPNLSSSTDTVIYMYYGNPSTPSLENEDETWRHEYKGVYHLNNDFGDSSGNGNHGSNTGTTDVVNEYIADSQEHDGTDNQYIDLNSLSSLDNIFATRNGMVSFWVNMNELYATNNGTIISKTQGCCQGWFIDWDRQGGGAGSETIRFYEYWTGTDWNCVTNISKVDDNDVGTWSLVHVRQDSSGPVLDIWVNGTDTNASCTAVTTGSRTSDAGFDMRLFNRDSFNDPFDGKLDEVRFYNETVSDAWLGTEWNNQRQNANFIDLDPDFELGGDPLFAPGNFTIGNQEFNQTNTDMLQDILFERNDINDTHTDLYVKYPNDFNTTCNLSWQFAMMNNTYSNLDTETIPENRLQSTFTFVNSTNDVITVYCFNEDNTAEDGTYVLTIFDFPLLQQIANFRDGTYGTQGQFGALDLATLFIIIVSMIGFNRINESVGVVFNVFILGIAAFFNIITIPTALIGGLVLTVIVVVVSTRKD